MRKYYIITGILLVLTAGGYYYYSGISASNQKIEVQTSQLNSEYYSVDETINGLADEMRQIRTNSRGSWSRYSQLIEAYYSFVKKSVRAKNLGVSIYNIKSKDNLWKIAYKCGKIGIDTVVSANPYLVDTNARLGQKIIVISKKGFLHRVKKNETLENISSLYRVSEQSIKDENILPLGSVRENDILFIPRGKRSVIPANLTAEMTSAYELASIFISPICAKWGGRVGYTSYMGVRVDPLDHDSKRFHNGVDIRLPLGTNVCAVASGIVIESGWGGGYGKMVKIRHSIKVGNRSDTFETLYGHNSRILVKTGQYVKQGQVIAKSGNTGRTTGPHLHFTVWRNEKTVDPLKFLWR